MTVKSVPPPVELQTAITVHVHGEKLMLCYLDRVVSLAAGV